MKIIISIVISFLQIFSVRTLAQQTDSLNLRVPESLYLDISTLLLIGNASINFETPFSNHILFRTGLGGGYVAGILDHSGETSFGLLAMVNFLTAGSSYRFEFGLGASLNKMFKENRDNSEWKGRPALVVGYRYQSYSGGFVFRIGLGYTFAFGTPLYLSFGWAL